MVRIGTVWDRTLEVISGRFGMLAGIALIAFWLPAVVRSGWTLFADPGHAKAAVGIVLAIATVLVLLWGILAVTAVASSPTTTRDDALVAGRVRLLPALGVVAVLIVVFIIAVLPGIALLIASGFDYEAASRGAEQTNLSAGAVGALALFLLVYLAAALWASARLSLLYAIVVNERLGLGAFRRSFDLTRGLTGRIVGVIILYAVIAGVLVLAVTSVVGIVFRLALGADNLALSTFLTALIVGVVTAGLSVLQNVFLAQLYIAAVAAREGAPAAQ